MPAVSARTLAAASLFIVNLDNAINALSGLPLREQLGKRDWRRLFADQLAEGLASVKAGGITPVSPPPYRD